MAPKVWFDKTLENIRLEVLEDNLKSLGLSDMDISKLSPNIFTVTKTLGPSIQDICEDDLKKLLLTFKSVRTWNHEFEWKKREQ